MKLCLINKFLYFFYSATTGTEALVREKRLKNFVVAFAGAGGGGKRSEDDGGALFCGVHKWSVDGLSYGIILGRTVQMSRQGGAGLSHDSTSHRHHS